MRLSLWWKFEGRYIIYNFKNGVKNLVRWFPIVWRDRDYDHTFILSLLQQKLIFQSKYIGGRAIHTTAKRDAEIMMTVVKLIDKVKEGYYDSEYLDYQKSNIRWEKAEQEGYSEVFIDEVSEDFDEYFNKYPRAHKKIKNREKYIFENDCKKHIAMNLAHYNHKRAKDLIFKILSDRIEGWWD